MSAVEDLDETETDDGATHRFWAFIERIRAEHPAVDFDPDRLENVRHFLVAVRHFDAGDL